MTSRAGQTEEVDQANASQYRGSPPDDRDEERSHGQFAGASQRQWKWFRSHRARIGIGSALLITGTVILLALSLPGEFLPGPVGGLAAVLLALGTLVLGTSKRRSV